MGILARLLRRERNGTPTRPMTAEQLAVDAADAELQAIRDLLEVTPKRGSRHSTKHSSADEPLPNLTTSRAMLDDILRRCGSTAQLAGCVDDVPLESLLRLMAADSLSGRLWIRTASELLTFDVRAGTITRAESHGTEHAGERLGEILNEMRLVTTADVQEHLERSAGSNRPFGVGLLASGLIRVEDLREALRRQSSARFKRAFESQHAGYAFFSSSVGLT